MKPGTLLVKDDHFAITCEPHAAIKLRRLFGGVHRARAGEFSMRATPSSAFELSWFMDRYPLAFVDADTERAFKRLVSAQRKTNASIAEIEADDYVPPDFAELAVPPREYQKVATALALKTRSLLICDEIGLGKTLECIAVLTERGTLPALVVAPTHLPRQWEQQIARFLPRLSTHRLRKSTPYKWSTIKFEMVNGKREPVRWKKMPDVIITSYSKLDGWVEALAGVVKTVIFDEVQDLRTGPGTRKYDAAVAIAEHATYKIGASASPVYNYGSEMHNVVSVIAPAALGTRGEFLDEWCTGADYDGRKAKVREPAALGTHLREIGVMIRRTRRDVGRELPPITVVHHAVECDADRIQEASASVQELAERVLARTGTNFDLMKWGGEIDYRMRQATGIAKAPAVADLVHLIVESGEKVLLYAWHHEVYAIYRSRFDRDRIGYAMYTGDESEGQKAESVRRFIYEDDTKVLIMSLRSGVGLDGLQAVCATVVTGELDWSPEIHKQDIGRLARDGQGRPVVAYMCVADEGSDPVVCDALGIKNAQADGILNPHTVAEPMFLGATDNRARRLAEDVLRRLGVPIPSPVDDSDEQVTPSRKPTSLKQALAEQLLEESA